MGEPTEDRLLSIGRAAKALGISVPRLRRLADTGRVPYELTDGGHRRFDISRTRQAIDSYNAFPPSRDPDWSISRELTDLDEAEVWMTGANALALVPLTPPSNVFHYVVTEMVNNAIDHSNGTHLVCNAWREAEEIVMEIVDDGIGIFERIRTGLDLPDVYDALVELSKGKLTTAPAQHTGEGIFFTSKAVDLFQLEANSIAWIVDNVRNDSAVGVSKVVSGTRVLSRIGEQPVRDLNAVFDAFTDADKRFSKSRVVVKLAERGNAFVSRSEAKRLMNRLEEFEEVELDFTDVSIVGQGFVDEVFRVWSRTHAETELKPTNMNEAVRFMVERGLRRAQDL